MARASAFLEASVCAGLNILVAGGTQNGMGQVLFRARDAGHHRRQDAGVSVLGDIPYCHGGRQQHRVDGSHVEPHDRL